MDGVKEYLFYQILLNQIPFSIIKEYNNDILAAFPVRPEQAYAFEHWQTIQPYSIIWELTNVK